MPEVRSIGERIQKVPCARSVLSRHDDQIVDLFLRAWQEGRFTHSVQWLPQHRANVEVIAADASSVRIAVEHTRLFAYEDHKLQEEALRPLANLLEAESGLRNLDRQFHIRFQGHYLGGLLRRFKPTVTTRLYTWAVETLPRLEIRDHVYRFEVPILVSGGRSPTIPVEVEVSETIDGTKSVMVGGYLPPDPGRFVPVVRKALTDKLPKLADAEANLRILLLELPIINESPSNVIAILDELAAEFPSLQNVTHFVVANTFVYETEGYLLYWVRSQSAEDWSDILQPVLSAGPSEHDQYLG
jgi:hypothetical protein